MKPDRIVKMDIEEQSLVLVLDEVFLWRDQNLTWQDDIGLHEIMLKADQVWTPAIYAYNILEEEIIRQVFSVVILLN